MYSVFADASSNDFSSLVASSSGDDMLELVLVGL